MKNLIVVVFFMLFNSCLLFSQDTNAVSLSGVFKNAEDYKNERLSFQINCDVSSSKIRLNDFFSLSYLDVIQNGRKARVSKDSVFGYRDCRHNDYRFYKNYNHEYRILENNTLVIYVVDLPVQSSSGKTDQMVPSYFFSRGLDGNILPLSILNLKRVFPGNIIFHDQLDVVLHNETALSSYDVEHKTFMVNFLLNQSLK